MAETREALLLAGEALFAEQGLDGPSLDAICERAGRTRGAFYVHFADRDEFLAAVMERVGAPYLDAVLGGGEHAPRSLADVAARFIASVASGAYPLTRPGGPKPHQLLDACARSPRVRARYVELIAESISRLEHVITLDQREHALRDDVSARAIASALLAAVIGAHTMIELGAPIDLGEGAAALITMLAPR